MRITDYFGSDLRTGFAMAARRIAPCVVTICVLFASISLFDHDVTDSYKALLTVSGLLALLLFPKPDRDVLLVPGRLWVTAAYCLATWLLLVSILLLIGYATKTSELYSRKIVFSWILSTPVAITAVLYSIDRFVLRIASSSTMLRKVIIAGANELGRAAADKIRDNKGLGLALRGFFDDRGIDRLGDIPQELLLGGLQDMPRYVKAHNVDLILIALPIRNVQRVTELLEELQDTTASIYFVPDVFVFELIQCRTDDIDGLPVVALCETPFFGTRAIVKRLLDVAVASTVLLAMAPAMIAIALGVKLTTPGSIIFKQRRYGLDGHEIVVYKFRSMSVSDRDESIKQATRNDVRTTPFGAFLRRYSLDELPQFFNVLQGRMSVVGPRPHAVTHNEEYRRLIKGYMIRHKVCPGITGLAQIRGLRGETTNIAEMAKRVEADLEYLRNWSLALDLRIMYRTAVRVFRDEKAY